jgi:hypothetical protein
MGGLISSQQPSSVQSEFNVKWQFLGDDEIRREKRERNMRRAYRESLNETVNPFEESASASPTLVGLESMPMLDDSKGQTTPITTKLGTTKSTRFQTNQNFHTVKSNQLRSFLANFKKTGEA